MQRQRLEESGIIFPPRYERSPYHAEVSAVWLHKQLERHEPDIAGELTWVLRDAMGGHHGRFIQEDARDLGRRLRASEKGGTSQREEWRAELIRRMEASEVVPTHVGVNRIWIALQVV